MGLGEEEAWLCAWALTVFLSPGGLDRRELLGEQLLRKLRRLERRLVARPWRGRLASAGVRRRAGAERVGE